MSEFQIKQICDVQIPKTQDEAFIIKIEHLNNQFQMLEANSFIPPSHSKLPRELTNQLIIACNYKIDKLNVKTKAKF